MFRGEPPSSLHFALANNIDYKLFYTNYGEFKITEIKLMPQKIIEADDENKKISFLIKIKQENKKIFEKKINVGEVKNKTNLDSYHHYSEANPVSLILDLDKKALLLQAVLLIIRLGSGISVVLV